MSTSKTVFFSCIVVLVTVASCSDLGDQPFNGLAIQTSAPRHRMSDTLAITVTNNGPSTCGVASCNAALTYYIEIFDQDTWKDRDSINMGPCLALYGPIFLTPGQPARRDYLWQVVEQAPPARAASGANISLLDRTYGRGFIRLSLTSPSEGGSAKLHITGSHAAFSEVMQTREKTGHRSEVNRWKPM